MDDQQDIENDSGSSTSGRHGERKRHRRRIKIRKRVRIKKKVSGRKKARKLMEMAAWVLIIAAFIITIVMLVLQLDLDSKHRQKKKGGYLARPEWELKV
jgi:hypothetical protein